MPTPSSTGLSVTALQRRPICSACAAQRVALAGDARAATRRRRSRATVRRSPPAGRRVSWARRGARSRRRPRRPRRPSRRARRAGGRARSRRRRRPARRRVRAALVSHVRDEVVIRHHDRAAPATSMLGHRVDHADRRRAEIERALARFLDRAAVHDRVGERDPDLDRVGARVDDGAHDVAPLAPEPAGDVRHEQLARPRRGALAQMRSRGSLRAHRASRRPGRRPCRPGPTA